MDEKIINELAVRLSEARIAEANAKDARIEAEEAIIAQLTDTGEAERRTIKTGVGLKLTVQTGLSYNVDSDGIVEHAPELCDLLIKSKTTHQLDTKAYEAIRGCDPLRFEQASKFVTTKPKKTSVTLAVS